VQRVLDERRDKQLPAVPYFDGLITGETDALIASFAGEPELHHPVHGRIRAPTRSAGSCGRSAA
jgi:hypothetical protein